MKITGNTILVTGGTSGIGHALAEAFYDLGNEVIITGRRDQLLRQITAGRPHYTGICLDVADPSSVIRLGRQIRDEFPHLNVLIANAGISRDENIMADGWNTLDAEEIVETNILGVLRVTAALLPILKKHENAAIMATASALAFIPKADFPTYCASKAFLHSWLQSLRHQLQSIPIEVLELLPPYVQTALTGDQQVRDPRAMPLTEYIAKVMTILAEKDHANGEILLECDHPRRWAEKNGSYDQIFAAMNPLTQLSE